jgi:hypothetical protein
MQLLRIPKHLGSFFGPLKFSANAYNGDLPREVKLPKREADCFLPFDAEVKNLWSYIFISHASPLWCLNKYRYNFTFVLIVISLFLDGAYTNFLFVNWFLFGNEQIVRHSKSVRLPSRALCVMLISVKHFFFYCQGVNAEVKVTTESAQY